MVDSVLDNNEEYVCISHMQAIPCNLGKYHLVSNWPTDIARVLDKTKQSR